MAARARRNEKGELEAIVVHCDHAGCARIGPEDKEIAAAGGLKNMGWHCAGGRHFCPDHAKEHRNG